MMPDSIAYAPQQAWIFFGSMRKNIIYDTKFDATVRTVLKSISNVCAVGNLRIFCCAEILSHHRGMLADGRHSAAARLAFAFTTSFYELIYELILRILFCNSRRQH